MKLNVGTIDRIVRVVAGIAIGVLWYFGQISGTAAIILGVVAVVLVLTGAVGFCPAYLPIKLSTRKED